MDQAVRPQDDLFEHANGLWLRNVQIPADRSRYGVDSIMSERAVAQQRALLEAARSASHTDQRKAGELYASFMNEQRIEMEGLRPIQNELARIDAVRTRGDLTRLMAHLDRLGVAGPLSSFIDPDARQSDRYAFWIYGSGLGLPERDYYFSQEPARVETRRQYENYLTRLLTLLGHPAPDRSAREVLALETEIAGTHWSRVDARDPEKTYNPVSPEGLSALAPEIDWSTYLEAQGLPSPVPRIIARQPSTISAIGRLLASAPLQSWKTYSACACSLHSRLSCQRRSRRSSSPLSSVFFKGSNHHLSAGKAESRSSIDSWARRRVSCTLPGISLPDLGSEPTRSCPTSWQLMSGQSRALIGWARTPRPRHLPSCAK
jgi:predicted metalloendopeptidase